MQTLTFTQKRRKGRIYLLMLTLCVLDYFCVCVLQWSFGGVIAGCLSHHMGLLACTTITHFLFSIICSGPAESLMSDTVAAKTKDKHQQDPQEKGS